MKKLIPVQTVTSTEGETDLFQRLSGGIPVTNENKHKLITNALGLIVKQDQYLFYPLIEELFSILGFHCKASRAGDTNNRADAYIIDDENSIPIEIKSPTEIPYINNKSIRQAAENKVILLSRNFYSSSPDVSSLAVGYEYPNERSGVYDLIEDIYKAYGFAIGIISIKDLLNTAWEVIVNKRSFDKSRIIWLKGQFK